MRRLVFVLALLLTASLSAQTPVQSADEIINKYLQTVGGADRIQAVKSLRRTGRFTGGGGFEAVILELNQRPSSVRQEFTIQGFTGVTSYEGTPEGTSGWKFEPFGGKKDIESLSEDELKAIIDDSDFDGPLVNYQQKGNKVEYVGMEPVDGTDTYKLKVTLKNGDERYYYMDADYYVPIKIDTKRTIRGAEREFETILGDYKQVNGWYLPHSLQSGPKGSQFKGTTTYETIEANVDLPAAIFSKPADAAGVFAVKLPAVQTSTTASAAPPAPADRPVKIDSDTISGLGARNIGSAAMSGRISAIDAVHEKGRLTIYIGAASGGVWKSVNGGTTYKPVFDKATTQSIGALAIDPKDPKTVWAGTGESWVRNSVSIGDGIYKTTDGGDNWANMGLPESERITKIAIDPTDTNTVYVCVPGKLWSDSNDRGLYKTTDGGKTWSLILKGSNPSTGCGMLSLDDKNPKTLFASLWDFRRKGWEFRSGGAGPDKPSGSGLFKSTDGGATWTDLNDKTASGLPTKPWGRVAMTIAPSNSNVVYALVEAEPPKNALYRSDDGGKTWQPRDRSQNMIWRPFYFANLIVDPKDENKIYKGAGGFIVSNDGGKTFSDISGGAHGDFHDLWIDPASTDHLIVGDDGGLWYSYDSGNRWWKGENLPVSQFYHVSVDNDMPYHVYGGLQDNASWVGDTEYPGGITNGRWENMYFGDGFWMFPDPADNNFIYAELQGGEIGRVNRQTREIRAIKPQPGYKEGKLRFNWNTPIHMSPTEKGTVYIGSQFLFRTRDHGTTWERISPDLTTNDPVKQRQEQSGGVTIDNSAAEMHTTIFAIAESPKNGSVIWAGTDDGNLQVTRDGGKTWTNVVGNIAGLPKAAPVSPWVSYLHASTFDEGTVFATFDLHTFGDMRPYSYKTTDFGKTWTSLIPSDAPVKGYAHVIRQDLVNPNLLFLGTEKGLWVSLDGGKQWAQYKGGDLPNVAVRDLVIHPRDNDLVIATHGRGIWIIDDITPLRALTPEVLTKEVAFLQTAPVEQQLQSYGGWSDGDAAYNGANPPGDAVITYYQRRRHIFGDLKMDVTDASGKAIGTIPSSKRRGLSRALWSMRLPAPTVPPAASADFFTARGPRLLPGTYTVKMVKDQATYSTPVEIVQDPRSKYTMAERKAQFDLSTKLHAQLGEMSNAVARINGTRLALDDRASKLPAGDALAKQLRGASSQVDELRKRIVATKEGGMITGEERLREFLLGVYGYTLIYEGPPTQDQFERGDALARELADVVKDFDAWASKELPSINAALAKKKLDPINPSAVAALQPPAGGGIDASAAMRRMFERE